MFHENYGLLSKISLQHYKARCDCVQGFGSRKPHHCPRFGKLLALLVGFVFKKSQTCVLSPELILILFLFLANHLLLRECIYHSNVNSFRRAPREQPWEANPATLTRENTSGNPSGKRTTGMENSKYFTLHGETRFSLYPRTTHKYKCFTLFGTYSSSNASKETIVSLIAPGKKTTKR